MARRAVADNGVSYITSVGELNEDRPVLLCLHGASTNSSVFTELATLAANDGRQLIAPDYLRRGATLADTLCLIAETVADLTGGGASVHAFGHGLGGHILSTLSPGGGDAPLSVKGVALCGAPPLSSMADIIPAYQPRTSAAAAANLFGLSYAGQPLTRDEADILMRGLGCVSPYTVPMTRGAQRGDKTARRLLFEIASTADARANIESSDANVVLFHGSKDNLVGTKYMRDIRTEFAWKGRVIELEGGHLLPLTRATTIWDHLVSAFDL